MCNTITEHEEQNEGFTLLEVVTTVAIVLILSVGGFLIYQGFTDNARQAAVESAANQVLTAVVADGHLSHNHPAEKVQEYNSTSSEITANITTANAEQLVVTAQDTVGTTAVAIAPGNYGNIYTTKYNEPGATFMWDGTPHNSHSVKYLNGVEEKRNLIPNPRFKNNAAGWDVRELMQPNHTGQYQVIPRGNHFSAMPNEPAVGEEILHMTRQQTENVSERASMYARLDPTTRPNIEGYSHIAYAVPMQGSGKTWMYFRDTYNSSSSVGNLPETDFVTYENGGWLSASGEIPEGAKYADLYIGTPYEIHNPEGERYVNEVYYGSPIMVVGNSQEEVDIAVYKYFDGDSQ